MSNSCDVTVINPFNAFCTSTDASAPGVADGSVSISVVGGTPPYSFTWDHGPTGTASLNNLLPGTYTCLVSDFYGDNAITVICEVGVPFLVNKFEICLTDDPNNLVSLLDLVADREISFQIDGNQVFNLPNVGDIVKIEELGLQAEQTGLRTSCCYQRIVYNPNHDFIGFLGTNTSTRVVFSSPTSCEGTASRLKTILPQEKINLFNINKNANFQRESDLTKDPLNNKVLDIQIDSFREIRDLKPESIKIDLPDLRSNKNYEFELEKFQIFPSNINVSIQNDSGRFDQVYSPKLVSYRMREKGGGVGTLVFNGAKMFAAYRLNGKQIALEKKPNEDKYIIFDTNDTITQEPPFSCGVDDLTQEFQEAGPSKKAQRNNKSTTVCTSIALDLYDDFVGNTMIQNMQ